MAGSDAGGRDSGIMVNDRHRYAETVEIAVIVRIGPHVGPLRHAYA